MTDHALNHATHRAAVLQLMLDLQWHGVAELMHVGGIRYGARLLELRRQGWKVVSRGAPADGKEYRFPTTRPGVPQRKRVKPLLEEADVAEVLLTGKLTLQARAELDRALRSFRANKEKL